MSRTVDVVICTYSMDRVDLLSASVASVLRQTLLPAKLVLVVDHNDELFTLCRRRWGDHDGPVKIVVRQNQFEGRLGSARNTGLLQAESEIVAFLDDDAAADPTWLETLVHAYDDCGVTAVGGAPLPDYGGARPTWWPPECDWIFGCHYRGMPETRRSVRHLIGANMSVNRDAIVGLGGFYADDHDDMDLSHRIAHKYGKSAVVYEPDATVRHFVPAQRLNWSYFWRRCYFVNRSKVGAFATMADAGNIDAELAFALRAIVGFVASMPRLRRDRPMVIQRAAALAAVALAGVGYLVGRIELILGRRKQMLTAGLPVQDARV